MHTQQLPASAATPSEDSSGRTTPPAADPVDPHLAITLHMPPPATPQRPTMPLSLITPATPPTPRPRYFSASIDLLRGHPSTTLLPTADLYGAASIALNTPALLPSDSYADSRHPLHYGPDAGNLSTRIELGRWVAERYGHPAAPINPDRLCLTAGASNALAAVLSSCTSPVTGYTRRAFLVSPTYFLAARIFEDAGFADKLTAIPTTSRTSFDLAALSAHLSRLDASSPPVSLSTALRPILRAGAAASSKRLYRYVLYCVPTYSNPTGETLDLPTRHALLALARQHDMLVVTDDVYDFLGNTGDRSALGDDGLLLPRLVTLDAASLPATDATGHTVSNCSFSKLLGPGLRAGWIESATTALARQVATGGANHSGGAPCQFASTLVHPLLLPHSARNPVRKIDVIISRFVAAYTANARAAVAAARKWLPADTEVWGGKGGFFVWLLLPAGIDAGEVVRLGAAREGVVVAGGGMSECPGPGNACGWEERAVRVSVSYCVAEEVEEGVRRLGLAVERWRGGERCGVRGLPGAK
ncbi:pyridoxal phosphate-dependent transferase [Geopyxis carbonaria]|nr:pyridoxal phosphate-dependent transferase [Geopyxis carbonaria]